MLTSGLRSGRAAQLADDDDPALRIGPARHQLGLDVPTFSGFGQFSLYILSLGKQAVARPFSTAATRRPSSSASGASARAVTTSTAPRSLRRNPRSAPRWTLGRQRRSRATASRRKAAFLRVAFDQMRPAAPGSVGERAGDHQPGKAARRSRDRPSVRPPAPARRSWSESAMCRSRRSAAWTARSDSSSAAIRAAASTKRSSRADCFT